MPVADCVARMRAVSHAIQPSTSEAMKPSSQRAGNQNITSVPRLLGLVLDVHHQSPKHARPIRSITDPASAPNSRISGVIDIAGEMRYECPISIAVVALPKTSAENTSSAINSGQSASPRCTKPPETMHAVTAKGVSPSIQLPPGAPSRCQAIEPIKQPRTATAKSIQKVELATSETNSAVTASKPSAVRNCTRKKRGGICADGKIGSINIRPAASRRQNVATNAISPFESAP